MCHFSFICRRFGFFESQPNFVQEFASKTMEEKTTGLQNVVPITPVKLKDLRALESVLNPEDPKCKEVSLADVGVNMEGNNTINIEIFTRG